MLIVNKTVSFVVFFILSHSIIAGNFVDKNGKILPEHTAIWDFVNKEVGDCPRKITFKDDSDGDGVSRFVGNPPQVMMGKPSDHPKFKMILAHETSHICLFNKTGGMSNQERFRFFDEGLADIIGGRFVDVDKWYKKLAFERTKKKLSQGKVSFHLVQKWKEYFGTQLNVDYDAYMVGATFNFFLEEEYGPSKQQKFFRSIAKTQTLAKSINQTFGIEIAEFEKKWTAYIKSK
jgi:hypothetical protein